MAHKIQIKRGNKADLPTLNDGELGLCVDTNEVYVGNNGANVLVNIPPLELSNNLTTTVAGSALDATQGKTLAEQISTHTADNLKYAEYTLSGNQSIASSSTPSPVTWGTKTAINSEAFTALESGNVKILTAGVYEVCISVVFASSATGIRALHGAVNGTRKGNSLVGASGSTVGLTLTFFVNASVNDLITAQVVQTSGNPLDVVNDARYTYLQIRKVG